MIPQPAVNPVNVYMNDPNAAGLSLEQVVPPPGVSHFAIPGWTGAGGLFNPGTPEFEAGALFVILQRTYEVWCDFFGTDIRWQPGMAQLPISPRAGKDYNAYYDRQALRFFYNDDPETNQTIYACESCDVVAHECGHAALDAQHPDYWNSLLAETGAFHEAFGDISAMLVTLSDPVVRAAMLAENKGDLATSNAVSRLAEQLARGIADSGHPDSVVSPDALRDAVNAFTYRDPDTLPARAPASKLSSESHSFSRIFSGAFYDLLVGLYTARREADSTLPPDDALAQARDTAGHLLAQGLVLAPKGDAPFKTVASSMFTADAQNFGGKNFPVLRQVFVARRILKADEADALKTNAGSGSIVTSALGGTASGSVGAPIPLGTAGAEAGGEIPSQVRQALKLPKREFVLTREQASRQGRVLHYTAPRVMELRGADMGVARGAMVTVTDAVAVQVDPAGRVVSSQAHKVDRVQARRIRDHVAKLVERGRVYAATPGENIDPQLLIERKQPYYVTYDRTGNKRIRRAFIACHS